MKLISYDGLKARGVPHGRIQLWRNIKKGLFPAPIKVASRNCWVESEINEWLASRIAARGAALAVSGSEPAQ